MKNKIAALYIVAAIAIIALPAQAAMLIGVDSVTLEQYQQYFILDNGTSRIVPGSGAVWYAQLQAGGSSSEIQISDGASMNDGGDTAWTNASNNQFTLGVDTGSYLHLTANGVPTGANFEVPIASSFNEIWIGIMVKTGDPRDILSAGNQTLNGSVALPNLSVTGSDNTPETIFQFSGFKIAYNGNIAAFDITGSYINPNIAGVLSGGSEAWTWTAVGINVVPEPSSIGMIGLSIVMLSALLLRRYHKSSYPPVG